MTKKGLYILALIALPFSKVHSQVGNDSTALTNSASALCAEIARHNIMEGEQIGSWGMYSEQWERFQKLLLISNDTSLFELTSHSSPVVRGYAYLGLMERNTGLLMSAIRAHENDTALVKSQQGCIVIINQVKVIVLEGAYYKFVHANETGLNKEDEAYITQAHKELMIRRREMIRARRKK